MVTAVANGRFCRQPVLMFLFQFEEARASGSRNASIKFGGQTGARGQGMRSALRGREPVPSARCVARAGGLEGEGPQKAGRPAGGKHYTVRECCRQLRKCGR
jgi:hypothetical protein